MGIASDCRLYCRTEIKREWVHKTGTLLLEESAEEKKEASSRNVKYYRPIARNSLKFVSEAPRQLMLDIHREEN